jgi:hypothetical protein
MVDIREDLLNSRRLDLGYSHGRAMNVKGSDVVIDSQVVN